MNRSPVVGALLVFCCLAGWSARARAQGIPNVLNEIPANTLSLVDGEDLPDLATLDQKLGVTSLATVLASANRTGRPLCRPPWLATAGRKGFCWQNGDDDTSQWMPQGISGTWDAGVGNPAGQETMVVTWHDGNGPKGARVSFVVNPRDPAQVKYRHVLLVRVKGSDNFEPVDIHAGGIAWVGNYLYVPKTGSGLLVFDVRHMWKVKTDNSKTKIGKVDGEYYAYDYLYALPQVRKYTQEAEGDCDAACRWSPLCFSFVSVDRSTSPPSLLTGEYYNGHLGSRLVRWPIGPNGLLKASRTVNDCANNPCRTAHLVPAMKAYRALRSNLQGALSFNGNFAIVQSHGSSHDGELHRMRVGGATTTSGLPIGPEDLSYDAGNGLLWTLTEHPNNRLVIGLPMDLSQ